MRKLFTLLPLLVLTLYTVGQEAPKKASKIIVLNTDSTNTAIGKIAQVLFERGYTIDTKDDVFKYMITKEKAVFNGGMWVKIRASVNDTAIIFTGEYQTTMFMDKLKPVFEPITNRGINKSAAKEAWNELDAIAKQFGTEIRYAR